MSPILVAQEEAAGAVAALVFLVFLAAPVVLVVASFWRILSKAGEPGWKVLVPFYNAWTYARIVGRPGWWGLLLFVPLVNLVIGVIMSLDLARSFGKDDAFGLGLALSSVIGILGLIFYPILAFGDSRYLGPAGPAPRPGWPRPGQAGPGGPYSLPQGGYQPPPGQQWGPPTTPAPPRSGPPSTGSSPPTWDPPASR